MWNKEPKYIQEIIDKFPTEKSCLKHLENLRWSNGVVSPFDSDSTVYKCKGNKYRCRNTGKYFNAKTNTIFQGSRVELVKWFCGVYILMKEPKITSVKFAYLIDVTQKTAWFMMKRIRESFLYLDEKEVTESQISSINNVLKTEKIKEI